MSSIGEESPLLLGSGRYRAPRRGHTRSSGLSTPRSPFETGFPTLFTSPIPSPRPHRLSFPYDRKPEGHRDLHVFLTLTMSTVGAGMLSVPYTFLLVPSWAALAGIVAVGVAMALTANALLMAHVHLAEKEEEAKHIGSGRKFASFQAIAVAAGGDALGYAVSIITAIGIYGGCVGCIRIVRDISPFLVSTAYHLSSSADAEPLSTATSNQLGDYLMWATYVFVVFPLCLMKNLSGLHISSYLGFFFSLYLVGAIIYRSFYALSPSGSAATVAEDSGASWAVVETITAAVNAAAEEAAAAAAAAKVPTVVTGSIFSRFSHAMSIYNYAFMMHLNLIPLFIQLRGSFAEPLHDSRRKMSRCINGLSSFCVIFYAIFGLFAKKLYGTTVRGNVLLNLENDPLMDVPLVAVFCTVVLSFPLLFHPLRGVLEELVFTSSLDDVAFATRLGATTVLLLSQVLLAIVVPGIEVVFGLTGASTCFMICIAFPVIFFARLYPWQQVRGGSLWMATLWIVAVSFVVIGTAATFFLLTD
ncbi:hypothetical protein BBJ28_00020516 [Nothophytophthora sp. Chile5]|nr:hypothetical protein BBJ28_00020516 [Nothophytophthora sp. Chile5]